MLAAAAISVALVPVPDDVSERVKLGAGVLLAIGKSLHCLCQFDVLFRDFLNSRFRAIRAAVHKRYRTPVAEWPTVGRDYLITASHAKRVGAPRHNRLLNVLGWHVRGQNSRHQGGQLLIRCEPQRDQLRLGKLSDARAQLGGQ